MEVSPCTIGAAVCIILLAVAAVLHCLWLWLAPERALQEIIEQYRADDGYRIPNHEAQRILGGRRRWITILALSLVYYIV